LPAQNEHLTIAVPNEKRANATSVWRLPGNFDVMRVGDGWRLERQSVDPEFAL
jgi:hypothetical protein